MRRHEIPAQELTVETANDSEAGRCREVHRKADGYDRGGEGKLFRVSDRNEGRIVVDLEQCDAASRVGRKKLGGNPSTAVNHKDLLGIRNDVGERIDCPGRVGEEPGGAQLSVTVVCLDANGRTVTFLE